MFLVYILLFCYHKYFKRNLSQCKKYLHAGKDNNENTNESVYS